METMAATEANYSAWMSFDENERGSLEVIKTADMVIIVRNPYETDVTKLDALKVEQLFLQGEPYKKISQNPIGKVLKGSVCKLMKIASP